MNQVCRICLKKIYIIDDILANKNVNYFINKLNHNKIFRLKKIEKRNQIFLDLLYIRINYFI